MKNNFTLVIHDTDTDLISVHYLINFIISDLKNKKKNIHVKNIHHQDLVKVPFNQITEIYILNLKSLKCEQLNIFLNSIKKRIPLNIYIMGDFTKRLNLLIENEDILLKFKTKFLTLSESYSKYLENFLCPMNQIEVAKITISDQFKSNKNTRIKIRKKLGFRPNDKIMIYTGRISPQKNIYNLIRSFKITQKNIPNLKLILIGPFDYYESPAFNLESQERLSQFPPLIYQEAINCSSISFYPLASSLKLNEFLNASDFYINLSTYHDEDFGLSPREALKVKLPSLTTNWGGFQEINSYKISPQDALNNVNNISHSIEAFISKKDKEQKTKKNLLLKKPKEYFSGFNDKAKNFCLKNLTDQIDEDLYQYFYKPMGGSRFRLCKSIKNFDKINFPGKVKSGFLISKANKMRKIKYVVLVNTTTSLAKKILQKDITSIKFINYSDLNKMHSIKHLYNFDNWLIIADTSLNLNILESRIINHLLANGSKISYIKQPKKFDQMNYLDLSPQHCLFYF